MAHHFKILSCGFFMLSAISSALGQQINKHEIGIQAVHLRQPLQTLDLAGAPPIKTQRGFNMLGARIHYTLALSADHRVGIQAGTYYTQHTGTIEVRDPSGPSTITHQFPYTRNSLVLTGAPLLTSEIQLRYDHILVTGARSSVVAGLRAGIVAKRTTQTGARLFHDHSLGDSMLYIQSHSSFGGNYYPIVSGVVMYELNITNTVKAQIGVEILTSIGSFHSHELVAFTQNAFRISDKRSPLIALGVHAGFVFGWGTVTSATPRE